MARAAQRGGSRRLAKFKGEEALAFSVANWDVIDTECWDEPRADDQTKRRSLRLSEPHQAPRRVFFFRAHQAACRLLRQRWKLIRGGLAHKEHR